MRRILIGALLLGIVSGAVFYWLLHTGEGESPVVPDSPAPLAEARLSGPFTHENLSIFLVHGPDTLKTEDFLILSEAMEQKQFVIHETQSVNQLEMENLSDKSVIILSGDVLKGGQQDRIAQNDQVVPPRSGKLKLVCFCVEHTAPRWMRKLDQETGTFANSPGQLAHNSLRLANRVSGAQAEVWTNVAALQDKLGGNLKTNVKAGESDSSLALSLDHKKVQEETDKYVRTLADIARDKRDVIGYAFAINGKFVSADQFGSARLFQKVWPRLLKANAIEAIAEYEKDKKFDPATALACKKFMEESEKPAAAAGQVDADLENRVFGGSGRAQPKKDAAPATGKNALFETADKEGGLLRRNILAR